MALNCEECQPPSTSQAACLEKYPGYRQRYKKKYIYSSRQRGSWTRACPPTARHRSRTAEGAPIPSRHPLPTPKPRSCRLPPFPVPEQSEKPAEPLPLLLRGEEDLGHSEVFGKVWKGFPAAHSSFQPLWRPPQTSPLPLRRVSPWGVCEKEGLGRVRGGGKREKRLLSAAPANETSGLFPPHPPSLAGFRSSQRAEQPRPLLASGKPVETSSASGRGGTRGREEEERREGGQTDGRTDGQTGVPSPRGEKESVGQPLPPNHELGAARLGRGRAETQRGQRRGGKRAGTIHPLPWEQRGRAEGPHGGPQGSPGLWGWRIPPLPALCLVPRGGSCPHVVLPPQIRHVPGVSQPRGFAETRAERGRGWGVAGSEAASVLPPGHCHQGEAANAGGLRGGGLFSLPRH